MFYLVGNQIFLPRTIYNSVQYFVLEIVICLISIRWGNPKKTGKQFLHALKTGLTNWTIFFLIHLLLGGRSLVPFSGSFYNVSK